MGWALEQGDCLDVLQKSPLIAADSIDSIVTDPPAGIGFMGRDWDSNKGGREPWIAWMCERMQACYRVLKPGGHMLVWALPRTSHWTATAIEDAGFEVRDVLTHHFGSGFPKSQNVGAFIDKLAGAEREVVGPDRGRLIGGRGGASTNHGRGGVRYGLDAETAPATVEAREWSGWGTALKPATEHWILARKPLSESSIARNVLKHGTGALNIDACRVDRAADDVPGWHLSGAKGSNGYLGEKDTFAIRDMSAEEIQARCGDQGRFPPNLLLSHALDCEIECVEACPVAELDRQSGTLTTNPGTLRREPSEDRHVPTSYKVVRQKGAVLSRGDSGGASRFFPTFRYQAKPGRKEREAGLASLPTRTLNRVNPGGIEDDPRWAPVQVKNTHPTVKSKALMKWLITLVTRPGGWVLDPFCGSGSTGVAAVENGFSFFGIEESAEYCEIAEKRIQFAAAAAAGQMTLEGLDDVED